jgi:Kef-type K+ transport system membrane component KefB
VESTLVVQLFLAIGLIIAVAQVAGSVARQVGQPRVFGELLAGVFLGPTVLNMLGWDTFADPELLKKTLEELAELGVLFLMFTVGLEIHLRELFSVGKVALWGGILGGALPVAMGMPVVLAFDHDVETALFVGVVLAATSVSISAQTLLELGVLRTKEGIGLLATAVVDDILAILLLSVVIATLGSAESASAGELIWIFVRMMLYLVGALAVAWTVLPRLFNWLHRNPQFSSGTATFALVAALLFGWSAEALGGIAAITGAFVAGMGLSQTTDKTRHQIEETVQHIAYSFLVPIFFVNVGLHSNLLDIGAEMLPMAALLVVVAAISKVGGSGIGAKLGGFSNGEAFRLGVCMISRGEVGLIIAALGLANGLLDADLFEPVFLVILVTTVMTPPLVRWVFHKRDTETEREQEAVAVEG